MEGSIAVTCSLECSIVQGVNSLVALNVTPEGVVDRLFFLLLQTAGQFSDCVEGGWSMATLQCGHAVF